MTNLPETNNFDAGVYAIQTTDEVVGQTGGAGAVGIANQGAQNLTNRTRWLYNQLASLASSIDGFAPLVSPAFTGSPTCPTAPIGDDTMLLANTDFVQTTVSGVTEINLTGVASPLVLTEAQTGTGAIVFSGALTANMAIQFPAGQTGKWTLENATTGANDGTPYTLTFTVVGTGSSNQQSVTQGYSGLYYSDGTHLQAQVNDIPFAYLRAGGSQGPTADAPPITDNSNRIVTSAWVQELFGTAGANSLTANGYQVLPGGLILQWGTIAPIPNTTVTVDPPLSIAFPNGFLAGVATDTSTNGYVFSIGPGTDNTIRISCQINQNGVTRGSAQCMFIVVGY